MEHQLVVFELANEFYGIDIAIVERMIKMQEITVLPQTPAYLKGVTNLRGTVLPVIDLRILDEWIEPLPAILNSSKSEYLKEIIRLEVEKVLNLEEQQSLTAMAI